MIKIPNFKIAQFLNMLWSRFMIPIYLMATIYKALTIVYLHWDASLFQNKQTSKTIWHTHVSRTN